MTTDIYPDDAADTAVTGEDLHAVAVRRLRSKREFTEHLTVYLVVNAFLVTIWTVIGLTADFWFPWPVFPLAAWGIGLALHAWSVFGPPSRPITDAAVQREMRRLARH